jgi:hypothetical protein
MYFFDFVIDHLFHFFVTFFFYCSTMVFCFGVELDIYNSVFFDKLMLDNWL